MGVGGDLEGQRSQGLGIVGGPGGLGARTRLGAGHRGHVAGRRQVVDHRVEQGLHALVLEGRAVQHGHQAAADGSGPDGGGDLFGAYLGVLQELLEQALVVVRQRLKQIVAVELGLLGHLVGDVGLGPGHSEVLAGPDAGPHAHQVDDPPVVGLGADGQLDHRDALGQSLPDRVEHEVEVGAGAVHLVNEAEPGNAVAVGLAPHRLGLGLHAGDAVEHGHRAVEHPQRALHLDGEVDMARCVDDVDAVVAPDAVSGRRGDGDAPLLLLGHPVHRGRAVVDLADLVVAPRVVQDPLGGRGLARVDVRHDPDVPGLGQGVSLVSHGYD